MQSITRLKNHRGENLLRPQAKKFVLRVVVGALVDGGGGGGGGGHGRHYRVSLSFRPFFACNLHPFS